MTVEVREARPEDFEKMRPLMEAWIAECNPDGLAFAPSVDSLIESFAAMAGHPRSTTLVMLRRGEIIGCVGLVQHGWGASKTHNFVSENLWYVKREFRGYARDMIHGCKRWAQKRGCDYLIFSTNRLATPDAERGEEFLAALGFRPLYQLHIAEISHV